MSKCFQSISQGILKDYASNTKLMEGKLRNLGEIKNKSPVTP